MHFFKIQGGNYSNVLKIFAEGASFLRSKFGQQWDLPNANYRKNHAYFLYATVKDPEKGEYFTISFVYLQMTASFSDKILYEIR